MTHYVPAYAEVNGVKYRAICDRYVALRDHALTPACEECKALIAAEEANNARDEAAIADLLAMTPGPTPAPRPFPIVPAGYTPRKGVR